MDSYSWHCAERIRVDEAKGKTDWAVELVCQLRSWDNQIEVKILNWETKHDIMKAIVIRQVNHAFSASSDLKREYLGKVVKDKERVLRKVEELKVKTDDDNHEW